ncbi:hypothetical protein BXZ70DRAFT_908228 [Cristinia sonorae]|uniref:Uncharacterized protein n=1 Tax=Cristinia sonorae TaxID=1940300 RepID=A0A8K0UKN4_9AGAR|nr:hypothetical protein BXZ70DRAFT_908228 [Cristinia sonorae]
MHETLSPPFLIISLIVITFLADQTDQPMDRPVPLDSETSNSAEMFREARDEQYPFSSRIIKLAVCHAERVSWREEIALETRRWRDEFQHQQQHLSLINTEMGELRTECQSSQALLSITYLQQIDKRLVELEARQCEVQAALNVTLSHRLHGIERSLNEALGLLDVFLDWVWTVQPYP